MNRLTKALNRQWSDFDHFAKGFKQVDIDHPLEWHIGYEVPNQKTLLIISSKEIMEIDSSKSIQIERRFRTKDNRWTLTLSLLKSEQDQVFVNLCSDLILSSKESKDSDDAIKKISERYNQWSLLLEHQHKGLMDRISRKGLIGELLFLKSQILNGLDADMILHGWIGPENGKQDFHYSNHWYEIKAVGSAAQFVSISSIEQLDNAIPGFLVIVRLDQCQSQKNNSFTLNSLVSECTGLFEQNKTLTQLFAEKLTKYGYICLPDYDIISYSVSNISYYHVNEFFPKLKRSDIPLAINSASYNIDINMIRGYLE